MLRGDTRIEELEKEIAAAGKSGPEGVQTDKIMESTDTDNSGIEDTEPVSCRRPVQW